MSSSNAIQSTRPKITSVDGRVIEITDETFEAFYDLMSKFKRNGSITVHFNQGRIVEVVSLTKKVYR